LTIRLTDNELKYFGAHSELSRKKKHHPYEKNPLTFFHAEPLFEYKEPPKNQKQPLFDAKKLHNCRELCRFSAFLLLEGAHESLCKQEKRPFSGVVFTLILSRLAFSEDLFFW